MKKYNYNTPIRNLPKKVQNDIYKYIVDGYKMHEAGTGEKIPASERITKKDLISFYTISDIEENYPVDTLVQELNNSIK